MCPLGRRIYEMKMYLIFYYYKLQVEGAMARLPTCKSFGNSIPELQNHSEYSLADRVSVWR